jgi:hypothetical protein
MWKAEVMMAEVAEVIAYLAAAAALIIANVITLR